MDTVGSAVAIFYVVLGAVVLARVGSSPTVWRFVQGPGLAKADQVWSRFGRQLFDPDESDEGLSVAISDYMGDSYVVTSWGEPFEVRRLQVAWGISSATLLDEDVRVCTWHFLKAPGGVPTATWDASDFTALKTPFYAFWSSLRPFYTPEIRLLSFKCYKEGPDIVPPQPPVFDETPTPNPGTSTVGATLPPQVAISVTERTAVRRSWGRFYLPAFATKHTSAAGASTLDAVGRLSDAHVANVADYADTMYEAWITAGLIPVVYRKPLPARFSADAIRDEDEEPDLPARAGSCLSVDTLQVDNIYDVIRSRRFDKPTLRVQRGLG